MNFDQAQVHSHIHTMAMRMHAQHLLTWDQIKEVGKLAPMPWHAGPWIVQRANFQAMKMVQVELPGEWFTWRKMAIGMMFLWSPQWRVEIFSKIQTTSQTWVCLSHHYGVICITLHNLEKEAKQGSYKRSGGGISWVHENDASNQALDHPQTIPLEGGWNYTKKLDTFQEWNSKVGMAKVVQESKSWLLTRSLQRGFA